MNSLACCDRRGSFNLRAQLLEDVRHADVDMRVEQPHRGGRQARLPPGALPGETPPPKLSLISSRLMLVARHSRMCATESRVQPIAGSPHSQTRRDGRE
jgi:hypothetical protein